MIYKLGNSRINIYFTYCLVLSKHGLNNHEIRPKSGLILRERTVERERREREKRRRRREREEEKREKQAKIKGTRATSTSRHGSDVHKPRRDA